ncbi:MAG: insulinase family protein [Gemmatimonadota bacterium]|nr:insulinase family protein [Gemmatimonadota bacterium]
MRRRRLFVSMAFAAAAFPIALRAQGTFPTKPPPASRLAPAKLPPFQQATLGNGVHLVLVERHDFPVLSVTLSVPAGSLLDPPGKEGLASLTGSLLTKGAGNRGAEEISSAIENVGGSISAGAGSHYMSVNVDALSENAPLVFQLVGDAIARPTFPEKEVDLARTQTLSGLQLQLSQPASIAERAFARGLYGDAGYGRRATPASVRGITRADIAAFHSANVKPAGALLVIAGDITLAKAKMLAEQALKGWTGAPATKMAEVKAPARDKTEILLVNRPGSVQSNVIVGNTAFAASDPRYYGITLANRLVGEGADSRLFMILREQKSWTYGAYSGFTRRKDIGEFSATAEVRTSVTDSSIVEMLKQLHRIGTEPATAKELSTVKESLVGRFPLQIETAQQVANNVSTAIQLGLPPDYLATFRTRLAGVTVAEVQSAAKAAIRPEAAYVVVVGDAAQLYDKLAKIAPTKIVSVQGEAMTPAQLTAKVDAPKWDLTKLAPARDSFVVFLQGKPFGFQRTSLEKTADGYRYVDDTQLGTFVQQHTELLIGPALEMRGVKQTGKMQGQDMSIDMTYANGRAKGAARTPGAAGMKTVTYDTTVVAGAVDDNAISLIVPLLPWAAGAKFVVPMFASGQGISTTKTYSVVASESVTVPAGTFDAFRVDMSGGEGQPLTMWVTAAAPYRVLKFAPAGAPVEIQLAKHEP